MMKICILLVTAITMIAETAIAVPQAPSVLFIIADDASRHYGEAYGCDWVKTPHIDQLAKAGLIFDNAYTPTSKCAPSRAAIMTGRNPWQLEDAANHQPYFPAKFKAFSEALVEAGVYCGGAGKTWGPGEAKTADGQARDFALGKATGVKGGSSPGDGLATFLKSRPEGKPFFYWFGSSNPHRGCEPNSGIDASPTKSLAEDAGPSDVYWQHAFGKRPGEQLFDVAKDPDCVNNLAADPAFTAKANELREKLLAELKHQKDPRVLGHGDVFDNYLSPRAKPASPAPPKKKRQ
jgi:arylsulfatase A-like enzyme